MPYKNKEQQRAYQRNWMAARRNMWIEENGPCVKCGSNDNLEVDHINPKLKTKNPSQLWALSVTNPIRIEELKNCQVLCESCHSDKTHKELFGDICPNGHSFDNGNNVPTKFGYRRCLICKRQQDRDSKLRKRTK